MHRIISRPFGKPSNWRAVCTCGWKVDGKKSEVAEAKADHVRTDERTWEISDLDGSNKRTVTLAQYRAELDARKPYTKAISDALRRGDIAGVEAAQKAMRQQFSN